MQERARDVGPWSLEKLSLLKKYLEAYVRATRQIRDRGDSITYVDLFAGPGLVRLRGTNQVSDGSPLIALKLDPGFSRFVFVDTDAENIAALQSWISRLGMLDKGEAIRGDSNDLIQEVARLIPTNGACFAFLDPPAPVLTWNTITQLAQLRMWPSGNKPEQFILFPYNMGLVRMMPEDESPESIWGEPTDEQISRVMPDPWKWRAVYAAWQRGSFGAQQKRLRFLYLYWAGLKELGYRYVLGPRTIRTPNRRPLYDLFFCSDHPVGGRIMLDVFESTRQGNMLEQQLPLIQEDPYEFHEGEQWYLELAKG